jgi:DNA-binding CsgD family transcriptional regulator
MNDVPVAGAPISVTARSSQVFVVANPRFIADALSRALLLAGWRSGASLASPAGLVQNLRVEEDDVIVVVDSDTVVANTVMPALRQLFPKTRLLALSNQWFPIDNRSEALPLNCGVLDVISAIQRLVGNGVDPKAHGLTGRHLEILQLIAKGRTTEEAGVELGIAPKTVNNHLSAVYRRLGARNLTQAVLLAARAGLIDVGAFA